MAAAERSGPAPGPSAIAVFRTVREIFGDRARFRDCIAADEPAARDRQALTFDVDGGRIYAWAKLDEGREMVVISTRAPGAE